MAQHQPPVPQRLSSISSSPTDKLLPPRTNIPPFSGLDRLSAQHPPERHRYTANNNIIVDHDFLTKFSKTVRTARQVGIPPPSSVTNRGRKWGEAINGNLNIGTAETGVISQRQLRPRASSPLLGVRYQTHPHEPLPSFHAKAHPTLRQPESSSATLSSRDPLKPPSVVPQQEQALAHVQTQTQTCNNAQNQTPASFPCRDLAFRRNAYSSNSSTEPNSTNNVDPSQLYPQDEKEKSTFSSSSSKPKHRPPMIDLSKLFPKPSDPSVQRDVPLLSPHRMTMSPSPVSLLSDASSFGAQQRRLGSIHQTVNKLTKPPSSKELSALRKQYEQQQQQGRQPSQPSPVFPLDNNCSRLYDGRQQQHQQRQQHHHSQASQPPTPQLSHISYQQQPVKKEKERFFQRGRRERKRHEEEQQRQKKQQEEQLRQRLKQEQKDRELKQRERLEREQQRKRQEQVQQEKEEYFQRQIREKQRREEHKRKEEPDRYERRRKQEPKQREEEQQQELQQRQLKQQRQEELQSQHYQFPFHEKRTSQQRKPAVDWFDGPAGHVSDDDDVVYDDNAEGDDEPAQYGIKNPPSVPQSTYQESAYSRGSGNRGSVHSNAMSGTSRASSRTLILSPVPEPAKKATPELHSNTSPLFNPEVTRFHSFFHDWDLTRPTPPSVGSPATALGGLSRKSSKITLNKSDLNESSVLCLSSSEDEADEEEMEVHKPAQQRVIRDSIATFDEGAAEIFTAKTVSASRGSAVPRVRNTSLAPQRISRGHSTSSKVRTPSYRPSNGIPTISEPDSPPQFRSSTSPSPVASTTANPNLSPFDFQLHVPGTQNSIKAMNRRSRVIAVTRQEEELLEVIRQHGGSMPPNFPLIDLPSPGTSFFNPMPSTSSTATTSAFRKSPSPSTDRSTSSQHGSGSIGDTSFLALSPGLPPTSGKVAGSISAARSDSSRSHHALSVSDSGGDHHSNPSPRVSLVHPDTYPSPSTSWTSPRTPQYNPPQQQQQQQQQQQPQKHYPLHSQPHHRELTRPSGDNRSGSSGILLHQHHVMLMHPQPLSSYPPTGLPPLSTSSPPSPLSSSTSPHSPLLSPPSPLPSVTAATPTTGPKTTALDADVMLPVEETKRHSRTRTDSSSAMVFGDGGTDGDGAGEEGGRNAVTASAKAAAAAVDDTELPIWALGWNSETPGLAVVH
ncbi:hypothetical protein ACJ73_07004 [Blastomyces percursus]|uniref:Uncharacterized protein n=1 Tax=Blastomyces percursus TaxID=1658174 RepID=A0A1J9QZK9_9EURO|nr:hypothetical protein ACJ73_07004 [Blastomyces percursus]